MDALKVRASVAAEVRVFCESVSDSTASSITLLKAIEQTVDWLTWLQTRAKADARFAAKAAEHLKSCERIKPVDVDGTLATLFEEAEESLEKLGIQNGVIHFEAKINKYGPMPIEVNLRMGGDEVYSFVKGAWNIDLVDNAAKIACNIYIDKVEKPDKPRKYITGSYFLSPHSGVLVQLDIKERKINRKPVEEFHFYKKILPPLFFQNFWKF